MESRTNGNLRKITLLMAFSLLPTALATAATAPYLAFSDLASGPNTGNSDTSKGQVSGANGAIVSVWGSNLGSSQGTSTLTVNGARASVIYYWGDAVPPWSPANLHNGYQKLQVVIFQVPAAAVSGAGTISVMVNGTASNGLPFSVRPGRIFFVASGGSDSNSGNFQSPWATIINSVKKTNQPGDILYVEDGVNQSSADGSCYTIASICPQVSGTPSAPIAFIAFPGATSILGNLGTFQTRNSGGIPFGLKLPSSYVTNITIAKFTMQLGVEVGADADGTRIIGNTLTAPNGNLDTGGLHMRGNDVYVLGNEFFHIGCSPAVDGSWCIAGYQDLYHVTYITGNRETSGFAITGPKFIEWNYLHDNNARVGLHMYQECPQVNNSGNLDCSTNPHDVITGHHVDHNVVVNQYSSCIDANTVAGENWIYDNLCINTGGAFGITANTPLPFGIDLRAGDPIQPALIHVYNNTLVNSGCPSGTTCISNGTIVNTGTGSPFEFTNNSYYSPDVHNNLVYQSGGWSVLNYVAQSGIARVFTPDASTFSNNLWFGSIKPTPSWEINGVNADPLFMSSTSDFHLQLGSPAIGKGSSLGSSFVTDDLDGNAQPFSAAYDLGTYSFTGGSGTRITIAPANVLGLRWQ